MIVKIPKPKDEAETAEDGGSKKKANDVPLPQTLVRIPIQAPDL